MNGFVTSTPRSLAKEPHMTPLRRRMIDDMTLRNFTPATIKAYVRCVARFALYFHSSPDLLGPEHVRSTCFISSRSATSPTATIS
jgi:hypothetical protein